MNKQAASYSRYWQPTYTQAMTSSLLMNTVFCSFFYPLEFLKTVIQFRSTAIGYRGVRCWYMGYNPNKIVREMHANGRGISQLFEGLDAHLLSRVSYLFIRNTIYNDIYNRFKPHKPTNDLSYREKALIASFAGGIAAVVTNPLTVISVRQIIDTQLKDAWQRKYTSIFFGLLQLKREGKLWAGVGSNVMKHIMLNCSLTGFYDYMKESMFFRFGEHWFVEPVACLFSVSLVSCISLPFDNLRTKLMQMNVKQERNRLNATNMIDCIMLSLKIERNWAAMWAGFTTYFINMLLFTQLLLGSTRQFSNCWRRKKGLLEWQM